ncbi:hypothetical protein NHX12_007209 [Muraenolepis orangiensis]|uniref:tRNA N(3)-cytidine methyltransferase n=1 Tax=Muraenolepis orangiensis TaxID=630683 RepID=A0A9Q0DNP5_9TELE|nr:hypothetical protein NHX12_007209 [Muraenolepis orangiensis]
MRLKGTQGPSAPLGARFLTSPEDMFQHNMWDHVQWTEKEEETARQRAEDNSSVRVPQEEQAKYDTEACRYWNTFYETHHGKFFKDRQWLFREFPELLPPDVPERPASPRAADHQETLETLARDTRDIPYQHADFRILEVGCGVGNSVFPIVKTIKETGAFVYCCDFSPHAIQLVKDHPDYDPSVCHAFVHDLCEEGSPLPIPLHSLDVVMAVFVFSSIHPTRLQAVVDRLARYLRPGGVFLFRDHGRHDLSQLRFKKGQCLAENFYTRGDGTCAYFFTKDEVHRLFTNAGLEEVQNLVDRRIQVNRGKKVVMHRVWMQGKFRCPGGS